MCVRGKAIGLRRQLTAEQRESEISSGFRIEKQVLIFPLSTLGSTYGSAAAGVDCGNIRDPSLLSRRRKSRCALHFKRKGGYERRIYKEEISVVCVVSLANAQFVLKLDNIASPKCYFVLILSLSIQAALAFKANSASQMQGLHYQLL